MDFSDISIQESKKASDFFRYLGTVICNRKYSWIIWIATMKLFGGGKCKLHVVKFCDKVIGGFVIADFPVAKYKPYTIFNQESKNRIRELRAAGYLGFCCFIIDSNYRDSGIGGHVFDIFFKKDHPSLKIYFTASKKAVPFYLRHGCKIFYPSRHTIYTFENTH